MPEVEVRSGVRMAYEDDFFGAPWTKPETVVMVHGNSESSRAWGPWVPHLAGRYRVVRLNMPGFGASPLPAGDYTWSSTELAADFGRFLDKLAIARCHMVAAKYGGSAAMVLASDQPQRLLSLTLCGSPIRGSGTGNAELIRTKGVRGWAAETMRSRLGSAASEAMLTWWTDELMGKTPQRAALGAASARIDMDLEARLPKIMVPTLMLTTVESGLQSVEEVRRFAGLMPDARVTVLPGDSFHIAAVAPDVCAQHALRFMASAAEKTHA